MNEPQVQYHPPLHTPWLLLQMPEHMVTMALPTVTWNNTLCSSHSTHGVQWNLFYPTFRKLEQLTDYFLISTNQGLSIQRLSNIYEQQRYKNKCLDICCKQSQYSNRAVTQITLSTLVTGEVIYSLPLQRWCQTVLLQALPFHLTAPTWNECICVNHVPDIVIQPNSIRSHSDLQNRNH